MLNSMVDGLALLFFGAIVLALVPKHTDVLLESLKKRLRTPQSAQSSVGLAARPSKRIINS
jgi:hypothetical protein